MLLLTPKKAQALLTVGDTVYFIRNGAVQSRTVEAIQKDCLDVGDDLFFFDEVAKLWFSTSKQANMKCQRSAASLSHSLNGTTKNPVGKCVPLAHGSWNTIKRVCVSSSSNGWN